MVGVASYLLVEDYVRDHDLVGLACGGIAIAVIIALRGVWVDKAAMTIDGEGLWFADWKLPLVPWHHVAEVYTTGIRLRPLLRIDLVNSDGFFKSLDADSRKRIRGNHLVKEDHLLIPNGALDMSIKDIMLNINAVPSRTRG